MRRKKMVKDCSFLSLLIFACLICLLPGCSAIRNFFGFNHNDESRADAEAKIMRQFSSHIRAPRGNPDSHYLLGRYYIQRGRYKEALAEFTKATSIDPDHVKAYNAMAVCYDHLKEYGKAAAYYKMALAKAPDLDYVHNNMGYSFTLQGEYDSAIMEYTRAIEINARNTRFHNNLAALLARTGRPEEAAREFEFAGNTVMAERERLVAAVGVAVPDKRREQPQVVAEAVLPDSSMAIEISNGNGINNMARNVAAYLRTKGFSVVRCTNATNFYHTSSEINYQKEAREVSSQIAREIPEIARVREVKRLDRPNLKVKVVIGKDLAGKKKFFEEERG